MKKSAFISAFVLVIVLAPVVVMAGAFFPIHREAMSNMEPQHITGTCDACRESFLVESLALIGATAPVYVCEGCLNEIAYLLALAKEQEKEEKVAIPFALTPFLVSEETEPFWVKDPRFRLQEV